MRLQPMSRPSSRFTIHHRTRLRHPFEDRFASPATFGMLAACAVALGVTALTAVIGASSPIVDRPAIFVTLRTVACVGLVAVSVVILVRDSSPRMPLVLVATSFAVALAGLTAADSPIPFVVGRMAVPLAIVLAMYVCFAYPSGRVRERSATLLVSASAVAFALLLAGNLLLTRAPPVAGPFVRCSGSRCPPNPLALVALGMGPGNVLQGALSFTTAVSLLALAVLLARRAARATPLQRSSVAPLVAWALLASGGYAFYISVRAVDQHAPLLEAAAVIVAAIIAAVPLAIALGLLLGRVFVMRALELVIAELGHQSSLVGVQDAIAQAFSDPGLRALVWDPPNRCYRYADGQAADLNRIDPERKVTVVHRDGEDLAAVVHDPMISNPVLEAAGAAISLALDNQRLETDLSASIAELEASRRRVAWAADEERRRIEQDLHDGAQQRLIALRIKLELLEEMAADDPGSLATGLADAAHRVDGALEDIRNLARGIYPSVLRDLGLSYALSALARDFPVRVTVHADLRRRLGQEAETAIYFCCLEALQNVAKHGGPRPRAHVELTHRTSGVEFVITDNGPGFDVALLRLSHGLTGMRDRLAAIGGRLMIDSAPGHGTTVIGRLPRAD